ncbi:MAG TPA: hypothetical protein EYM84_01035 [Flavobacteriales bacterium]|nr:hypothetical protein [Flavobacteriales bacterium]
MQKKGEITSAFGLGERGGGTQNQNLLQALLASVVFVSLIKVNFKRVYKTHSYGAGFDLVGMGRLTFTLCYLMVISIVIKKAPIPIRLRIEDPRFNESGSIAKLIPQ